MTSNESPTARVTAECLQDLPAKELWSATPSLHAPSGEAQRKIGNAPHSEEALTGLQTE